jgi:hypothetical protein
VHRARFSARFGENARFIAVQRIRFLSKRTILNKSHFSLPVATTRERQHGRNPFPRAFQRGVK